MLPKTDKTPEVHLQSEVLQARLNAGAVVMSLMLERGHTEREAADIVLRYWFCRSAGKA